jgi:glycosyltransferase involved in cell wall biosynthesis
MPITVLDMTMNLVNRTAVHYMGQEIYEIVRGRCKVRYWRFFVPQPIDFTGYSSISNVGKFLGRLAFRDLDSTFTPAWPRSRNRSMLFLEPLFAKKTNVCRNDVVLCHDIAPITHPEFYSPLAGPSYEKAYRRIQRAAPAVVFVSEFTKAQFLERFPADYRRCLVIPLYLKPSLSGQGPTRPNTRPFFLMVGTLESRKNYKMALEAFARSGLADLGYDLVIVGPRGNLSRELLPLILANDHIKHFGFVSDAQLKDLYATATALFFPSLVEGFGVPALEAPQSDLLPIVSMGTVLEEIVGPDGIFVDPLSIDSMAQGLRRVVSMNEAERAAKLARIKDYQRRYSLENFRTAWSQVLLQPTI